MCLLTKISNELPDVGFDMPDDKVRVMSKGNPTPPAAAEQSALEPATHNADYGRWAKMGMAFN